MPQRLFRDMQIHDSPTEPRFTTDSLRPDRRLEALRERLDRLVQPGDLRGVKPRARVDVVGAGGGWDVTRIVTSPLSVVHGQEHVAERPGGYLIWLQLNGEAVFRQGAGDIDARPGMLVIRDAGRPSEAQVRRPSVGLLVRVPLDPGNPPLTRAVALGDGHGPGIVLRQFLVSLTSQDSVRASEVLDVTCTTLRQLLQDGLSAVTHSGHEAALDGILAVIEGKLHEPDLGAQAVASSAGISIRTLHRTLGRADITFRSYILARRLECCRQDMMRRPRDSITTIGFRWGFNDLSHFCRAFKRRFGATPSAYRRRHPPAGA